MSNNDFAIDEISCQQCGLWQTSSSGAVRRSGVYGRGKGTYGLMLVGEALGAQEVMLGLPFVGDSGQLLSNILKEVGIPEDDIYTTNAVLCRPPNNRAPKASEVRVCMEAHRKLDMPTTPPKLVVTLGNVPLKAVLGLDKITERRGNFYDSELFGCKVLPTFHPSAVLRDPRKYDTVREDFIKAREYIMDQSEKPPKCHRELINSKEAFLRAMAILADPSIKERNCDIETTGLLFFRDEIASVSFTIREGDLYSFAFLTLPKEGWWHADLGDPEIHESLQNVLVQSCDFQNGLFDVQFFWRNGYQVNYGMDTTDMHAMIDENSPHNMRHMVSVYNKFGGLEHKTELSELGYDKSEISSVPPELLLDINIDDTYHGFLLKEKFTPLVKAEGMEGFLNKIQMPFKRVLTKMSYRGIMMDRERIITTSDEYREKIKLKEQELWDVAKQEFEYTSTQQLSKVLFQDLGLPVYKRTEKGFPSTDKEVLEELADKHPVPKLITELRYYKGMLQKYLDGNDLGKKVDPENGYLNYLDENDRIHGPFLSFGTYTGRPSCPKPNLLNPPKRPEIRTLFIAPPGWKLIEVDYSQAELILLANLAEDQQMMADVKAKDLHAATAMTFMKTDKGLDEVRRKFKAVNFLKSYGGGKKKLARQLKITEEEAESWLRRWDELYPSVPIYKQAQALLWREQGYIEGIYGRKKRFPPALTSDVESYYDRIAVNFCCQNGVADHINTMLIDIDYLLAKLFGWTPDVNHLYGIPGVVLSVYDSIIVETPDEYVPEITELMTEIMSAPLPKLGIPLKMDVTVSQRWGEKITEVDELEEELVA